MGTPLKDATLCAECSALMKAFHTELEGIRTIMRALYTHSLDLYNVLSEIRQLHGPPSTEMSQLIEGASCRFKQAMAVYEEDLTSALRGQGNEGG